MLGLPALLPAPHVGHDAVGAEIVAAVHHRDPGPGIPVPADGDALQDLLPFAAPEEHPLGLGEVGAEHLRQTVDDVGAKDDIHKGIALFQALRHVLLLGHAAAHGDDNRRPAALDVLQSAHVAEHPVLRVFPHGAGVEENEIRVLGTVCKGKTHFSQQALDLFPVRHILLAAVGTHIGQRRFPAGPGFHDLLHLGHIPGLLGKGILGKTILQTATPPKTCTDIL